MTRSGDGQRQRLVSDYVYNYCHQRARERVRHEKGRGGLVRRREEWQGPCQENGKGGVTRCREIEKCLRVNERGREKEERNESGKGKGGYSRVRQRKRD